METSPPTWKRPQQQGPDLLLQPEDPFHIAEIIGKGSYGTVYKLIHRPNAIHFALKVVYVFEDIIRDQLRREINTLRLLGPHPNVVQCHGLVEFGSEFQIIFEYIDGRPLKENNIPHGNEPIVANIAHQLLNGLANLHGCGIAHLDITPSNLLMMPSNQQVTISDFVSRILRFYPSEMVVRTFSYSAPERINFFMHKFSNHIDNCCAADIWSLGVIILELYLGYYPFFNIRGDWLRLLNEICESQPPEAPTWASSEFQGFISCCLQKETNMRWTAAQLLFHPFITGQYLPPLQYQPSSFSSSHGRLMPNL